MSTECTPRPDLSSRDCALLSRVCSLRSRLYGLQDADGIPDQFARALARSWRAFGTLRSLSGDCTSLAAALTEIPGGFDLHVQARDLAYDLRLD